MARNFTPWNKKITEDDIKFIIEQYTVQNKSAREINKLLGFKFKTDKSITDVLQKFGIDRKKQSDYASVDHFYFSNINTQEKAYILGLMITDGWVHSGEKHPNQVGIQLSEDDIYIIEMIKREWKTTNKIIICKKGETVFPNGKSYISKDCHRILVHSKQMQQDLAKYGVVERKSKSTILPILDKNLMSHFFRGMVDGNGTIGDHSDRKHKTIKFLGSPYIVAQISLYLHLNLKLAYLVPSRKNSSDYLAEVSYSKYGDAMKLGKWLYKDVDFEKDYYLKRKYEIIKDYIS